MGSCSSAPKDDKHTSNHDKSRKRKSQVFVGSHHVQATDRNLEHRTSSNHRNHQQKNNKKRKKCSAGIGIFFLNPRSLVFQANVPETCGTSGNYRNFQKVTPETRCAHGISSSVASQANESSDSNDSSVQTGFALDTFDSKLRKLTANLKDVHYVYTLRATNMELKLEFDTVSRIHKMDKDLVTCAYCKDTVHFEDRFEHWICNAHPTDCPVSRRFYFDMKL